MTDNFRGDNANLIASINALLELDAEGALVPHGIGGHARSLLSAAASRLSASIADTAGAKPAVYQVWCSDPDDNSYGPIYSKGVTVDDVDAEPFETTDLDAARQELHKLARVHVHCMYHVVVLPNAAHPGAFERRLHFDARSPLDRLLLRENMTENDIARVIFANLFPRGMCPADWDSGAILGPDNSTREQFLATGRAVLASIADTAGANCATCGAVGTVTSTKARCTLCGMFADTAGAKADQLTQAEQAAATLIAVGRLLEDAGYQPQCRILDAVRDVIAKAAPPAPSVADAARASEDAQDAARYRKAVAIGWLNALVTENLDHMIEKDKA